MLKQLLWSPTYRYDIYRRGARGAAAGRDVLDPNPITFFTGAAAAAPAAAAAATTAGGAARCARRASIIFCLTSALM